MQRIEIPTKMAIRHSNKDKFHHLKTFMFPLHSLIIEFISAP